MNVDPTTFPTHALRLPRTWDGSSVLFPFTWAASACKGLGSDNCRRLIEACGPGMPRRWTSTHGKSIATRAQPVESRQRAKGTFKK